MDVIDPRNLALKFYQNGVSYSWDIVVVVLFVLVHVAAVDPRNHL